MSIGVGDGIVVVSDVWCTGVDPSFTTLVDSSCVAVDDGSTGLVWHSSCSLNPVPLVS